MTSYMFSPTAMSRSGRLPSKAGTSSGSGCTRCGASLTISERSSERFAHEPEVEVLQVAQPAVDSLDERLEVPAAKSALLDERHAVAARGRVERHARPGDAAADHDQVERVAFQGGERVGAWDHDRNVT